MTLLGQHLAVFLREHLPRDRGANRRPNRRDGAVAHRKMEAPHPSRADHPPRQSGEFWEPESGEISSAVDKPFAYMKFLLEAIATGHPQARIDELLPWNFKAVRSPA